MSRRRALFALAPTALLLGLGELGARAVGAPECEPIVPDASGWDQMVGDPRYLWKLEPDRLFESPAGTTRVNAVGLRTRLLPTEPKAPGERRVLVTGDSSVYGWGQPDGQTYAEQLEAELNRNLVGVRVSVINLGVPGFSTEQTLRLLEDVGWAYDPDLLVVHNIFSDCNIDAFQDRAALALADPEGTPLRRALHGSRLYCGLYMPWARYQAGLNQQTGRVLMPGIPMGANTAVALETIDQVIDLSRVPLDDYLDNLDRIRSEAEARGATLLLAPLAQEWDVGVWNVPMPPPTEGQVLPWTPYREAQAEWATERGVGRVYLPDAFAAAEGPKAGLFIDNMHPSVRGAQVMAWAVTDHIRAHPELLDLKAEQVGPLPPRVALSGPAGPGGAPGGPPPGPGAGPQGVGPPPGPPQGGPGGPPPGPPR